MKEKIIENKQIIMLVLSILLIIIGATYAWFTWVSKDNTNLNLTIGEIAEVVYTSGDTISATNIGPVLDINDGEATSFSFKKRASGLLKTYIYITPTTLPDELKEESFKIALLKSSDGTSYTKVIETSMVDKSLDTEFLLGTDASELNITYYKVVIYIDGKMENPNTMMGKSFAATIRVDAEIIPIASEECFVFDESTGTITDYNPVESYDIHPECVANAQTNLGITEEEATTFCNGGEFRGHTIDGYISSGMVAELEMAGIITNVVYGASCPTNVVIPSSINEVSVTTIGGSAFWNNNLTSIVIPDSVTTIGNGAFESNNLTSVAIPNSVTTIGAAAFWNNNLTSVVIPDTVTEIGNNAFSFNNLTSIVIPDSVTTIGVAAFWHNNLTSVVIPDTVTEIGNNAFSWNNLTSVYIGANSNLTETTGIGQSAFSSSNRTDTSNGKTYVDNPNLKIYNNSGKKFKWYCVTQGRNDSTDDAYNFITGTVPSYTSDSTTYNEVTITTG